MTPYLLILAVLLGIAPGLIAHGKGRNFFVWWIYGVLLGPVALLHAILLRRHRVPSPFAPSPARSPARWRSNWPAVLWAATSVAIAIVAVTIYGLLAPQDFGMPASHPAAPPPAAMQRADPTRNAETAKVAPSEPPAPALTKTVRQEPTPTVRVTLRREPAGPEKVESAPVAPVERMVSGDSPAPASQLERTTPNEPAKAPPVVVAERTAPEAPATPVIHPPAPPPTAPKIASVAPTAPAAEPQPPAPEPPAPKPLAARPKSDAPVSKPAGKSAPTPTPTDVTAVGETVRLVQAALAERGYDPGPANGRAGRKTQAAIRKFQVDRYLAPTGTIDYALLEKLGIVGPRVHAFRPPAGMTVGR